MCASANLSMQRPKTVCAPTQKLCRLWAPERYNEMVAHLSDSRPCTATGDLNCRDWGPRSHPIKSSPPLRVAVLGGGAVEHRGRACSPRRPLGSGGRPREPTHLAHHAHATGTAGTTTSTHTAITTTQTTMTIPTTP